MWSLGIENNSVGYNQSILHAWVNNNLIFLAYTNYACEISHGSCQMISFVTETNIL